MKKPPLDWLHVLRNTVDYPLRQLFRWRRKGYAIHHESKDNLFATLPAEQRLRAWQQCRKLVTDYHLEPLYLNSDVELFLKNLYYLDILEMGLGKHATEWTPFLHAVDIGASDWFYAPALAAFLRWCRRDAQPRQVQMEGFEPDAYRVYADYYSRYDHALVNIRGMEGVNYIPLAFRENADAYQVVTLFFPFVFAHDHLEWGLPMGLYHPNGVLQAAWNSLTPGGMLLIVNQGKAEHQAQRRQMEDAGIPVETAAQFESIYYHYDIPHFLLTAQKP